MMKWRSIHNQLLGAIMIIALIIAVLNGVYSTRLLYKRKKFTAAITCGVAYGAMGNPLLIIKYKVKSKLYTTAVPMLEHRGVEPEGGLYLIAYDSMNVEGSRYLFSNITLPDTVGLGDDLSNNAYDVYIPIW